MQFVRERRNARNPRSPRRWPVCLLALLALVAAACGDDDGGDGAATTSAAQDTTTEAVDAETTTAPETTEAPTTTAAPTTTEAPEVLRIMVTNDDGVGAEGIDALVEALRTLPDTEVIVIAPAENQSGSSDSTTPGPLTAFETTTASGYPAVAVAGFPADTVVYAFDQGGLDEPPHLVISGINEGQNIGPFTGLSGTVGAAREAARRGVPALAASQGIIIQDGTPHAVYDASVAAVLEWLEEHRDEVLADTRSDEPSTVWNLDVPTCTTGEVRGVVEVPIATDTGDRDLLATDCASTLTDPAEDIEAFINGFAALTEIPVTELDALIATFD